MIKTAVLLLSFLMAGSSYAAPVTLVLEGKPACTIVLGKNPTQSAQLAALELQHQAALITGAEIPIVDDQTPVKGTRILIGNSEASGKLGFKKENYKGEEYEIRFLPDTIVIIGNDFPGYIKVNYQNHKTFPAIYYQDKPTLFGVYDFLERCCDIRYYAPTDAGITFTPRKTLTVEPVNLRRHPKMEAYRMLYAPQFNYAYEKPFPDRDTVLLKLRWRMTVRYGYTNHNVYSLYFKYWKKAKKEAYAAAFQESRPEYFAQDYGQSSSFLISNVLRSNYPDDNGLPPQPCQSHPEVIRHYAEEAVAAYNGKPAVGALHIGRIPGTPWFYPIVEDDNNALCQCPRCRELFKDKKGAERQRYIHYRWVNEIAKAAAKINPDVGISTLAYNYSLYYPEGMELSPNIMIQLCIGTGTWWHPTVYKRHHDRIFNEWMNKEGGKRTITIWTYFLSPGVDAKITFKYIDFFPAFAPLRTAEFFKEFADRGVNGWFGESNDEFGYPLWTNQLEVYLAARLCDDPQLDYRREIEDFFPRYYGAAARPMREFYRIVETASWDYRQYPPEWFENEENIGPFGKMDYSTYAGFNPDTVNWGLIGTRERMDKLAALMAEARKLASTPLEKQRVEWFDRGLCQSMERGRKKFEEKEQFMKRPVPELKVPGIPAANGDPASVNWAKAASTSTWKNIMGFPSMSGRKLQLAHDGEYLYGRFYEPGDASRLKASPSIWDGDTLELFFADTQSRPYRQLAINPDGLTEGFSYGNENGIDFSAKWTPEAKVAVSRTGEGFTILFALPLKNLLPSGKPRPGVPFHANFFRACPGRVGAGWSPIFETDFHKPARMGKIILN